MTDTLIKGSLNLNGSIKTPDVNAHFELNVLLLHWFPTKKYGHKVTSSKPGLIRKTLLVGGMLSTLPVQWQLKGQYLTLHPSKANGLNQKQ